MHYASIPGANWQELFAVALRGQDPRLVADRFCVAKDAIMDHIEESFDSASLSERKMLLAALNTITEMERSFDAWRFALVLGRARRRARGIGSTSRERLERFQNAASTPNDIVRCRGTKSTEVAPNFLGLRPSAS
jgi:hypothetical protein